MIQRLVFLLWIGALGNGAFAQIKVHPTGVNVNTHGATTVFLTYGGLEGYEPVAAMWCGELVDAFPDVGNRCDPATLFGQLPLRYNLSQQSNTGAFTDIMTIPPSVARRAYQAAEQGVDSRFFYVRQFSRPGAVDVYVSVTCRLTGGGARVPFALLDVRMAFETDAAVQAVQTNETLPPLYAEIAYNGTGQLRGRWEVVLPGEAPPTTRDLLTEATLPIAERTQQQRYTEVGRFSVFLPPALGTYRLPGPDPARLPSTVDGLYQILLRIEATDDKEGDSNLASVGVGEGVVHSGAVAGFPIPPLRYVVGTSAPSQRWIAGAVQAIAPAANDTLAANQPLDFSWTAVPQATLYRLEVTDQEGEVVLSAFVPPGAEAYRSPPWLCTGTTVTAFRWHVRALDNGGNELGRTAEQPFVCAAPAE